MDVANHLLSKYDVVAYEKFNIKGLAQTGLVSLYIKRKSEEGYNIYLILHLEK